MVTKWVEWSEREAASKWDTELALFPNCNIYQSYGWGEFKRCSGWTPIRWIARDSGGTPTGMVQILTKLFFADIVIAWVPGGPLCRSMVHTAPTAGGLILALLEALKNHFGRLYVRFDNYAPPDGALADAFRVSLVRPLFRLNTGCSLHVDLGNTLEEVRTRMTAKHRYYVKKALGENLEWRAGRDAQSVQALVQLHDEMVQSKRLSSIGMTTNEVMTLCRILGSRTVIFTGYAQDLPVTSCLVLLFERQAFYWVAATGSKGREISASYAMMYRLLEYLQAQGIRQFDFGGIVPGSSKSEGVNHFKRGFGGRMAERLGEWEWASAAWLRWGANLVIKSRRDWS